MTLSNYVAGSVTLVHGSSLVQGIETEWQSLAIGAGAIYVEASGGNVLPILSVNSNNSITSGLKWMGDSGTYAYSIQIIGHAGAPFVAANNGSVRISSDEPPVPSNLAVLTVRNNDANTCGIRVRAYWKGQAGDEYQNNDSLLSEVFNTTASTSLNRSWAGSFCNAMHNIPLGVKENGTRVGIIGWATSINYMGYKHEGTLESQVGVMGTAGYQGLGSGTSARITEAVGVRGLVLHDSLSSTTKFAIAGQFVTRADIALSVAEQNTAVYASARGGTLNNYSFQGVDGVLYNKDPARFGSEEVQSRAAVSSRVAGNAFEFGHPDPTGYGSNIGATQLSGTPFLAFSAEADPTGNTFRTRGRRGGIISGGGASGAIVFSQTASANASGQLPTEIGRFTGDGQLRLFFRPILSGSKPTNEASNGYAGEIAVDNTYLYVCVAANLWRRLVLPAWG